ncbi:MAG: hypothetical protein ACFCGT_10745 [Sandaracinaceae bacterium]
MSIADDLLIYLDRKDAEGDTGPEFVWDGTRTVHRATGVPANAAAGHPVPSFAWDPQRERFVDSKTGEPLSWS